MVGEAYFVKKLSILNSRSIMEHVAHTLILRYTVCPIWNDKLLIQNFPQSLTFPILSWFTKLEISKSNYG